MLLSCNIAEDVDEETDFDMNLPDNLKQFGFTAADWLDIIRDVLFNFDEEFDVETFQQSNYFIYIDNCSVNKKLAKDLGNNFE